VLRCAGFFIFALGNILNFCGFMFAAQSLCSALGSVQFVSNLIFATIINREVVTKVCLQAMRCTQHIKRHAI
jgi:magnesium transporter